jgi:glutaconate CoA-transferase subunit A
LIAGRPDWKVVDDLLIVPALRPDVALFHARWADDAGNVWVGRRRELATVAHASRLTFVTYEEKRDGDMLEDELLAPGVISAVYVSAAVPAPKGAWPLGVAGLYGPDDAHLSRYAKAAKTREGFQRYLEEWVLTPRKSSSPA